MKTLSLNIQKVWPILKFCNQKGKTDRWTNQKLYALIYRCGGIRRRECWLSAFSPFPTMLTNSLCLTLFQTSSVFMCLQLKSFENTVGKGEIARIEQFLLFPQCFQPIWKTFCHLYQI